MAEAARATETAVKMKNPLAKRGMEHIAASYKAFARRAEGLIRPGATDPLASQKALQKAGHGL
jgi:hypothetical protein